MLNSWSELGGGGCFSLLNQVVTITILSSRRRSPENTAWWVTRRPFCWRSSGSFWPFSVSCSGKIEWSYVNIWDYLALIHPTAFHTCAPEFLHIRSHMQTDISFKGEEAPPVSIGQADQLLIHACNLNEFFLLWWCRKVRGTIRNLWHIT